MNERQKAEEEDAMGRGVGAEVVIEEEIGIEVVIEIAGTAAEAEVVVGAVVVVVGTEGRLQTSMALQNNLLLMVITSKTRGPCHRLLSLLLMRRGNPATMSHSRRKTRVNDINKITGQRTQTTVLVRGGTGSNISNTGITCNTNHTNTNNSTDSCPPRHSFSHISTPGSRQPLG